MIARPTINGGNMSERLIKRGYIGKRIPYSPQVKQGKPIGKWIDPDVVHLWTRPNGNKIDNDVAAEKRRIKTATPSWLEKFIK
jgi:hypothetical protein